MLLIPLKRVAKDAQDVARVIDGVFQDIREKKALADFEVAAQMQRGTLGALVDALVLRPNVGGIGVDLKTIARLFSSRRSP